MGEAVKEVEGKGISGELPLCRDPSGRRTRSKDDGESSRLKDCETWIGDGRGLAVCMVIAEQNGRTNHQAALGSI